MRRARSQALLRRALRRIPGGVNSPGARLPRRRRDAALHRARQGRARLTDEDGNRYVDYVGSWGPLILGHAHPAVLRAVRAAAAQAARASARRRALEVELAERVCAALPVASSACAS